MVSVRFLGDSLKSLRDFAEDVRHDTGAQPDDFKPTAAISKGVEEIRATVKR